LIDLEVGFTAKSKKEFTPSAPVEQAKSSEPSSPSTESAATPKTAEPNVSLLK
jgi:hypothetical protein